MKKQLFSILVFLLACLCGKAQRDFYGDMKVLLQKNDTLNQRLLLKDWEKTGSADAEFYVCYFNYYVQKSRREFLALEKKQRGEGSLQLTDTGTGEPEGYLNSVIEYYEPDLLRGFAYIDTGILRFPDRLDMRFGKIYMLGKIKRYDDFTLEVIRTIGYSNTNKNAWLWSENQTKSDPQKIMLSAVQDYIAQLYDAGDEQMDNIKKIAEAVLKYYPDHVPALSDLAITYLVKKEYKKAVSYLRQAEKLDPKDFIVLNNLAYCYEHMDDKSNAVKYYKLTEKYGDEGAKKQAAAKLKELESK